MKLLPNVVSDSETRKLLERAGESMELRDKVKADTKTFVLSKVCMSTSESMCRAGHGFSMAQNEEKQHIPQPSN